ncbi:MAG: ATP-dependent sacrificial sulfur transferase LarE [Pyrinomonadaceae bacterium]
MTVARQKSSKFIPDRSVIEKEEKLRALMRGPGRVLVAYSGGVDSAYLAFVAAGELDSGATCVLGVSPSVSAAQIAAAEAFAQRHSLTLRKVDTNELDDPSYAANPSNRCYYCKTELYGKLAALAEAEGFDAIFDGANVDDLGDHRPGRKAAGEKGVRSPLIEAGMTKQDIRDMSRFHGLETWDRPASPCLSSRVAYGVHVTIERLSKIERAEAVLRDMGFREFRVRVHDDLARIEIARDEMARALTSEFVDDVNRSLTAIGFRYITLDLRGFRSGALNETINSNL